MSARKHKRYVYTFGWSYVGPAGAPRARVVRGRPIWLDRSPHKAPR